MKARVWCRAWKDFLGGGVWWAHARPAFLETAQWTVGKICKVHWCHSMHSSTRLCLGAGLSGNCSWRVRLLVCCTWKKVRGYIHPKWCRISFLDREIEISKLWLQVFSDFLQKSAGSMEHMVPPLVKETSSSWFGGTVFSAETSHGFLQDKQTSLKATSVVLYLIYQGKFGVKVDGTTPKSYLVGGFNPSETY